ncbi:hypothetical protein Tco_0048478, partial [Tanacetum coccineum]
VVQVVTDKQTGWYVTRFIALIVRANAANELLLSVNLEIYNIRVAQELDVRLGGEVSYAIRFEDRTSERTRIK